MNETPRNRVHVRHIGEVTVVTLLDRAVLQEEDIQDLGRQLFEIADAPDRHILVILDARNVEYLNGAALGKFITFWKKLRDAGDRLVLCNPSGPVREVLEATKLNRLLVVQDWNENDDPEARLNGAWEQ